MSQLASRSTSYSLRKSRHDQGNHQHTGVVLLTSIRPVTEHVLPGDFFKSRKRAPWGPDPYDQHYYVYTTCLTLSDEGQKLFYELDLELAAWRVIERWGGVVH